MNIYAIKGHKVRCITLSAGWKDESDFYKQFLTVGNVYTVDYTDVQNWNTNVYLEEIQNKNKINNRISFNSVFFEDIEEQPIELSKTHKDYYNYHTI